MKLKASLFKKSETLNGNYFSLQQQLFSTPDECFDATQYKIKSESLAYQKVKRT